MPAPSPDDLDFSLVSHLRFASDWKTPAHSHPNHYEMILILGGEMEVRIRGEVLRGPAGSVFVYPPGAAHEERAVDGPVHLLLAVWSERRPRRENRPLICSDSRGRIRQLLEWLHELPASDRLTQASLFHCALVEFARGADLPPDDPIGRVQNHIRQNFAQQLTLADLAKIAHQSPCHFARLFHQRTGQPPMRYLRRIRVEAAKTLVVTSPLPLRGIALMTGLVDEFHLSRVFRKVTGRPPSSLRRQKSIPGKQAGGTPAPR